MLLSCFPLALLPDVGAQSFAQLQRDQLLRVQAGYFSTFPAYVEWPLGSLSPNELRICLIGPNPFGSAGREYLQGRSYNGRRFQIDWFRGDRIDLAALQHYQMLYVSGLDEKDVKKILKAVSQHPVLTCGDLSNFLNIGGIVQFNIQGGAVTFDVSDGHAAHNHLKIDPRLHGWGETM